MIGDKKVVDMEKSLLLFWLKFKFYFEIKLIQRSLDFARDGITLAFFITKEFTK
ncbi:hypothetical protein ANHYDRO_00487 [Anaerococcus hydrogenalis DSM 7454]|uniref:Uncharacterized protein n=1 Tax=Anaerococcus hydrogenalis DSM 7454 TaxID=561177 RepID=B6W7E1_9FIRM|nr:hypothetical protein ANHYDRO_00487 [Anaerococcus hydrogenalis DSM 7454]